MGWSGERGSLRKKGCSCGCVASETEIRTSERNKALMPSEQGRAGLEEGLGRAWLRCTAVWRTTIVFTLRTAEFQKGVKTRQLGSNLCVCVYPRVSQATLVFV